MRKILILSLLASVAACSGGGGGDPPAPAPAGPASNNAGGNVTPTFAQDGAGGQAQTATVSSYDFGTGSTTGCCSNQTASGASTISMVTNGAGNPVSLTLNINDGGPGISQQFDITPADTLSIGNGLYESQINAPQDPAAGPTYSVVYAGASEPVASPSLNWTTYGYWSQTNNDGSGYGRFGAFAGGEITPAGAVPNTGQANYTGNAVGVASFNNTTAVLAGTTNMNVNFATTAVTGTTALVNTDAGNAAFDTLNFNGNVIAHTATISGATSTASGGAGNFAAQFNGPAAQEIGGTWSVQNGTYQGNAYSALGSFGVHQ